jgi:hypothetical protein
MADSRQERELPPKGIHAGGVRRSMEQLERKLLLQVGVPDQEDGAESSAAQGPNALVSMAEIDWSHSIASDSREHRPRAGSRQEFSDIRHHLG